MGRLKTLPPRIPALAPRIGYAEGDTKAQDRSREAFATWRAWYRTPRWAKLRGAVLLRDAYTCCMCGRVCLSRDMVADHVTPHRGSEALFWDANNLQALCHHPCHSKHKQAQERRDR